MPSLEQTDSAPTHLMLAGQDGSRHLQSTGKLGAVLTQAQNATGVPSSAIASPPAGLAEQQAPPG